MGPRFNVINGVAIDISRVFAWVYTPVDIVRDVGNPNAVQRFVVHYDQIDKPNHVEVIGPAALDWLRRAPEVFAHLTPLARFYAIDVKRVVQCDYAENGRVLFDLGDGRRAEIAFIDCSKSDVAKALKLT